MAESNQARERFLIPAATPSAPYITRLSIKKSRFVTQTCHCSSDAGAKEYIAAIRSANSDASHNCWAYVAGPPGDTAHIGSSDDGEPRGTAGRPMLNILLHCKIGQICVVVSRWFGGIKLGVGGLVRAYQDCVQENLATLPLKEAFETSSWELKLDYAHVAQARRILQDFEVDLCQEAYSENACFILKAAEDAVPELKIALDNATNGQCRFVRIAG